jgi:hypothetical protein
MIQMHINSEKNFPTESQNVFGMMKSGSGIFEQIFFHFNSSKTKNSYDTCMCTNCDSIWNYWIKQMLPSSRLNNNIHCINYVKLSLDFFS